MWFYCTPPNNILCRGVVVGCGGKIERGPWDSIKVAPLWGVVITLRGAIVTDVVRL